MTLDARDRSRAAVSLAPFAAAALLAWLAVPVGTSIDWRTYGASVAVLAAAGVLTRLERAAWWDPRLGQVPLSVVFLLAVALLRGSAGGVNSGAGALALIPVFYTALSGGDRRQLYAVLVALAAFYLVPIVLIGPPPYPHSQYRVALLSVSVSSIIGLATKALVDRVRQLAHEAAVAINRADQLVLLAGMAQTDPLTGLPNRRAWDARLGQAAGDGQQFAIAMLDLDHFKRFNDTHGHPAGDRLLVETAAAWRDQLRSGDLLARLGGEEFGLLLFDCELDAARDVTERLRRLVASDQTCSVGLTMRRSEEPVETVLARADRALYDAKAAGRDRACASV